MTDPAYLVADTVDVPVQVNGKVRSVLTVATGTDGPSLEALALADEKVAAYLDGKTVRKAVVIPGRLVNFVVS